mgnify:CR=1 FL=1
MVIAGTRRRWKTDHLEGCDASGDRELARRLGVPEIVAALLRQRGHADPDAARRFLKPSMHDLHDPALLPGCRRAAERIAQAVHDRGPIVIYGDYDVDGVTASAILYHTLTLAGARVACYVPHRIDEGYGLNEDALAAIASCDACPELRPDDAAPPLIVSVDCGITAVGPARRARELGVDLIITDHHEFDPAALPDAHALVHPRLPLDAAGDDELTEAYPYGELCGAGVAFKLAWQIARACTGNHGKLPEAFRQRLMDVLPLAALGTVADVVPLVEENRAITAFGLSRIKQTPITGLAALIEASGLAGETIDAYHVGFVLGPRLNACGRMGHAREAVRLLTTDDADEAKRLAHELTDANDERRAVERSILAEAEAMLEDTGGLAADRRAIVLGNEGWHLGVLGIVASRLVDHHGRPTVLLAMDDGHAHGSARSVDGVCMHTALSDCRHLLDRFGGHAMAAGLRLASDRVDELREAMVHHVNARLSPEELKPTLTVDAELTLDQCDPVVFEHLERLAPFGRSNPTPRLRVRSLRLSRPPEPLGRGGKHLALWLTDGRRQARAVAFGWGEYRDRLYAGETYDVVVKPKLSEWQGRRRAELHVEDLAHRTSAGLAPVDAAATPAAETC